MDMSRYMDLFISETREHLGGMNECIVALEKNSADRDTVDTLFRYAHSIKGMSASMEFADIAELAHAMEDLMDGVRKSDYIFSASMADLLLEAVDRIADMLRDVENGGSGRGDISEINRKLKSWVSSEERGTYSGPETNGLEESPPDNPEAGVAAAPESRKDQPEIKQTVRVKSETLDNLVNITGELVTAKHRLMMIGKELESNGLNEAITELSKLLRVLRGEVMKVRLMPFAALADRFPRAVRDTAKRSGKEVAFEVRGKDLEIDRGILEELAVPLVHLLRNAVDHGLETAEERLAAGKSAVGTVRLEVQREKDLVVITVRDDGRGMDSVKLIESAIERGLVKSEQRSAISPRQAFMLTCIPGFSTAQEVTDISGRGVGMDVVRCSVQSLGGNLSINSQLGAGTSVTVSVPLSVAIIHVLLVNCSNMTVAFPVAKIKRTLDLKREMICGEKRKVFYLHGEEIPIVSLNCLLGVASAMKAGQYIPTIITELRGKQVGLIVDSFEGQQEVFLKPLGRPLGALRGVAGGAILGDGRVIMVLDTAGLCQPSELPPKHRI
jgi:two-component system chemotaxis sensor kinase CheA